MEEEGEKKQINGDRLKKRRKELGYNTQEEFCNAINKTMNSGKISISTYKKWESQKNDTTPSIAKLKPICDKLNCSIDYLTNRIDETNHDNHFICEKTGLSETSVEYLCRMELQNKHIREYISTSKEDVGNALAELAASDQQGNISRMEQQMLNCLLSDKNGQQLLTSLANYIFGGFGVSVNSLISHLSDVVEITPHGLSTGDIDTKLDFDDLPTLASAKLKLDIDILIENIKNNQHSQK